MKSKRLLLMLLMVLLVPWAASAYNQQVQVGNGTTTSYYAPINLYYNYSYAQMIYTSEQINASCNYVGDIESISFYYVGTVDKTAPITVFMKTTEKTTFSSSSDWETVTADDIVFDGDWTVTSVSGGSWYTITFDEPFEYDGHSNLVIAINKGYYTDYSSATAFRYTNTSNQCLRAQNDGSAYDPYTPPTGTVGYYLPNIMFNMMLPYPAPSGLAYENIDPNTTNVTWTAPQSTNTVTGYAYQYKKSSETTWSAEETVNTTSASLTNLVGATAYDFQVKAIYGSNESCFAEKISFTTIDPCSAPTAFEASEITDNSAVISWTIGYDETSWLVKYKKSSETEYASITVNEVPTATLSDLEGNTTYNVVISPDCDETKTLTGNFTTKNPCAAPTNLVASNITLSSATLSWTPGYQETEWTVKYKTAAESEYTNELAVSGTPTVGLTGLQSGTVYNVRVFNCTGENDPYLSGNFTTAFSFPYSQDFTASGIPTGWTLWTGLLADVMGGTALSSATWGWSNGTSNGVLDGNHLYANIYSTSCKKWIVTPAISMPADARVTFDVAYTAYSGSATNPETTGTDDKFVVLASTDNMATWTIVRQWDNAGSEYVLNDLTPTKLSVKLDMADYAETNLIIAFYAESTESNADNNIHVDNVVFELVPSCDKPTNLDVAYEGGISATVTWVSDATAWEVEVSDSQEPPVVTTYNASETTFVLDGLSLGTTYSVRVRTICNETPSEWTNPVSFTTDACMPEDKIIVNYALADSYGDGWNGNYILVVDENCNVVDYITISYGSSATGTISVCGSFVQFMWYAGNYAYETSWTFTNAAGDVLFEGTGNASMATYDVLYTIDNNPYSMPTDVEVSEIGPFSAKVSWTETGTATAWQIGFFNNAYELVSTVDANTNPFTVTGLTAETDYIVNVRATGAEGTSLWPCLGYTSFTTASACDAPTELTAEAEATSATLNWFGFQDSYNVRYREATKYITVWEYDFENGIGEDWTIVAGEEATYPSYGIWYTINPTSGLEFEAHSGDYCASSWSWNNGVYNADNWLITPQIDLQGVLKYYVRTNAGYPDSYEVLLSTTDADITSFTVTLKEYAPAPANNEWNEVVIDLSAYAGQQGYIAIHHVDNDMNYLCIDDIGVYNTVEAGEWIEATVNETTLAITDLTPETEYEWQVQGVNESCDGGLTDWSALATFTTPEQTTVTQTIALSAGNNWFSTYLEITLDDLKAALVATGNTTITIKEKTKSTDYQSNGTWRGTLRTLDLSQMYMIIVGNSCEITLEGSLVDPAVHPSTIKNGTNWIAFPINESMSLTNAFAGFAAANDVVKSKSGGNARYVGNRWRGEFDLVPGQGYMYVTEQSSSRIFTYPTGASKDTAPVTIQKPKAKMDASLVKSLKPVKIGQPIRSIRK